MQNMGRAMESPEMENKKWVVNHNTVDRVYLLHLCTHFLVSYYQGMHVGILINLY